MSILFDAAVEEEGDDEDEEEEEEEEDVEVVDSSVEDVEGEDPFDCTPFPSSSITLFGTVEEAGNADDDDEDDNDDDVHDDDDDDEDEVVDVETDEDEGIFVFSTDLNILSRSLSGFSFRSFGCL